MTNPLAKKNSKLIPVYLLLEGPTISIPITKAVVMIPAHATPCRNRMMARDINSGAHIVPKPLNILRT